MLIYIYGSNTEGIKNPNISQSLLHPSFWAVKKEPPHHTRRGFLCLWVVNLLCFQHFQLVEDSVNDFIGGFLIEVLDEVVKDFG